MTVLSAHGISFTGKSTPFVLIQDPEIFQADTWVQKEKKEKEKNV